MSKTIRQTVTFKASPHEIYESFMDEKKHAQFTGAKVKLSRKTGGKFDIWDGEISGENLELVPDKKIVQTWRYSDWPAGEFSTATFSLEAVDGGTKLTLNHSGVPDEAYEDIKQGWKDYYWTPLKKYLGK
jgi:activator of HSP90 ATPase